MSDEKEKDTPQDDLSPLERDREFEKFVDDAATHKGLSEDDGSRYGMDPLINVPPTAGGDAMAAAEMERQRREDRERAKETIEEIEERAREREEREEARGLPKDYVIALYRRERNLPPEAIIETDEEGNPVGSHMPGEDPSSGRVL